MGISQETKSIALRNSGLRLLSSLLLPAWLLLATEAQAEVASVTVPLDPVRPSLWWAVERFEPGWVENLSVDPTSRSIRITLSLGAWSAADYVRRFAFIQKLGVYSIADNYSILLEDTKQNKLAEYANISGTWQVEPDNLGAFPFRVNDANSLTQRQ